MTQNKIDITYGKAIAIGVVVGIFGGLIGNIFIIILSLNPSSFGMGFIIGAFTGVGTVGAIIIYSKRTVKAS